ncbi:MAG: hypothetical protein IJ789_08810 [Bacteroidales bacterium]|nr:hypothetical protein [Bacteroidales bacterium]
MEKRKLSTTLQIGSATPSPTNGKVLLCHNSARHYASHLQLLTGSHS